MKLFAILLTALLPMYYPGEGVYFVGLDANLQPAMPEPTLVAEAYQATMNIVGVDVAAIRAGETNYNLSAFIEGDTLLNLTTFMGVGAAQGLVVRDLDGNAYRLGDYAPQKTWTTTHLWAAHDYRAINQRSKNLPLIMCDYWDCPISYVRDEQLAQYDAVTVHFTNPHEGLVVTGVSLPVVSEDMPLEADASLSVSIVEHDSVEGDIVRAQLSISPSMLRFVREQDGLRLYHAAVSIDALVLGQAFDVCVRGWSQPGVHAWAARAVDTHELYPSHTTYGDDVVDAASDACLQVIGYYNYMGTWGWFDGKRERGEVWSEGDLVQVYYDPDEPGYPGERFMGEAAFPVECTFGESDITVLEKPYWIICATDNSQWEEYGAVQLILEAEQLPDFETGRLGRVVFTTQDLASQYTIMVVQGDGWWNDEPEQDRPEGIDAVVSIPASAGRYDLLGRPVTSTPDGLYIENGKLSIRL